jgi:hypothetical protein
MTPPRPQDAAPRSRLVAASCAACLAWLLAVLVTTHAEQSPTRDELTHVTRGVAALWSGDVRLSVNHPPLANLVAALPSARPDPAVDFTADPGWASRDVRAVTRRYVAADYPRVRAQWLAGRLATLVFPALLLVYLAAWTRRRVGVWAAVAAPALLVTHPTWLAHASLTTTDMPVVAAMTIAACELARYLSRPGAGPRVGLVLATGLAVAVKFTGALVAVYAAGCMLLFAARGWGRFAGRLGVRLRRLALELTALVAGSVLAIDVAYGFQNVGWTVGEILDAPEPPIQKTVAPRHWVLERDPLLAALPRWLPVPLPYEYVFGVALVRQQSGDGRGTWFLGAHRRWAGPGYYPLLLVLKSPLAFVLALLAALALLARHRRDVPGGRDLAVVGGLAVLLLASATTSRFNIGVRHVLPCVPAMALAVGAAVELLARRRGRRAAGLALALTVVPAAAATLATRPDFLGYFNVLAGGDAGERWVSVLSEDWGQDVRALGRLVQARGLAPLYYRKLGHAAAFELDILGVEHRPFDCEPPPERAFIAIHDASLVSTAKCRRWAEVPPTLWIHNHIRVYDYDPATARVPDYVPGPDADDP